MLQVDSNGGLEQRLSSLQAQIDALRQSTPDEGQPLEHRLSALADYSAAILKQWSATADRHARAVGQLESQLRELGDAGTRLQHDSAQRLQDLEQIIEQEWAALRDIHEEPVRQLVAQAASLTEVCIATANSAQSGFDRAETRLATLEAEFHRTTAELTRELQAVLAEVRQLAVATNRQIPESTPAWPLEGVTRLHQQLRDETGVGTRAMTAGSGAAALPPAVNLDPVAIEPPPPASAQRYAEPNGDPVSPARFPRPAVIAIVVTLLALGGAFAWGIQRQVQAATERAEEARRQSQLAANAVSQAATERQQEAERQLAQAREAATRAQMVGDVLAAPDVVRYSLSNAALPGASGQVLWSRSRGFVFSASGLAAPPANSTYQVWLLTRGGPVSAGTFVPDRAGRATLMTTLNIPRAAIGAVVTTEQNGGAVAPTGEPLLARFPVAPPQP